MSGNKAWFFNLEEECSKIIKLGNDTHMTIVARGSVPLHVNGVTQVLSKVYYIPKLKNNLLSIEQLQEKGLAILILDGSCKVFHPTRGLIIKIDMSGNRKFYVITFMALTHSLCLQSKIVKARKAREAYLWHCRLVHLNYKALSILVAKEMVLNLPILVHP